MSPLLERVMRDGYTPTEADHLALLAECARRTVEIIEHDEAGGVGERRFSLVHPDAPEYCLDSGKTLAAALVLCRRHGFKPGPIHRMEGSR